MATMKLASWASSLEYSTIPESVRKAAIRSFYNWAGCAIGGSNHPATIIAHDSLQAFFGAPTSSLLGQTATRVDAQHAALLNGIASHVHDYDDTHLETIIHPTGPVASALLAFAESQPQAVGGEDFLLAMIAGIEAECKIGLAVWPDHYDVGWHITSTTGAIGAAVAVGRLLKLDAERMAHAIGIAAAQVTGLREMFGSHAKSFHVGRAAQNGLIAALLAKGGFTSSTRALEAKRGWANVVSAVQKLDELMASLGKAWETQKNSFKPFPCGIVIHPIIDGCAQLKPDVDATGKQIGSIRARVHPLVLELTGKKKPKDGLEAKFSVYHGGALGLLYGKATPALYEDCVATDPKVVNIRDKIEASEDNSLAADEAYITVTFEDGSEVEKHVVHAIGSTEVPMTDEQLTAKFVDQCQSLLGGRTQQVSDALWRIESAPGIAQLIRGLY